MKKTWNDFLAYCLERNVTERDFWIFVILGIIGLIIIVWSWIRAVKVAKKYKEIEGSYDFGFFIVPIMLTGFNGILIVMGLVNALYFFL